MGTWQDAIQRRSGRKQPATGLGCRNHGQGAIGRPQRDQKPDTGTPASVIEGPYNELSASIRCGVARGRRDVRAICSRRRRSRFRGRGTQPPPKPTSLPAGTTRSRPPTTPPASQTPPTPAARSAAATRSECAAADRGGFPIYPAAQFLASYDAGRGQRYYIYGATAPFADVVTLLPDATR